MLVHKQKNILEYCFRDTQLCFVSFKIKIYLCRTCRLSKRKIARSSAARQKREREREGDRIFRTFPVRSRGGTSRENHVAWLVRCTSKDSQGKSVDSGMAGRQTFSL